MKRPTCLDLFCCAGGAAHGYYLAGFDVTGVDHKFQKHYPYKFILGDALEYTAVHGHEYDFIHASPPCQFGSVLTPKEHKAKHLNLIPQTREILLASGKPYIIENVAGSRAYLQNPVMLCGSMFGLPIWRHRYFENNIDLLFSPASCNHNFIPVLVSGEWLPRTPVLISGRGMRQVEGRRRKENTAEEKRLAMGIDWMTEVEVTEAIPPVYTKYLGEKILEFLNS